LIGEPCTVLVVTYNRPVEIRRTLYAFLKNVIYPHDKLLFHLADDASPGSYIADIKSEFNFLHWSHTRTERGGWGKNVNTALKAIVTPFVFLMEDDYVANGPVDLETGARLMTNVEQVGLVRYDGLAGHFLTLHINEFVNHEGRIDYCVIDKKSRHLNVYSNRPHLRHKRFTDYYGYYPEGGKLGWTEEAFAHHVRKAPDDSPSLAILKDGIPRRFEHIGKSYQLSGEDVGKRGKSG